MEITSLYKVFINKIDKAFREQSDRSRSDRYYDAHSSVTEAFKAIEKAIIFDAYDPEDERKLDDIRKRLFHFQRITLERLYELRVDDDTVHSIQEDDKMTWQHFYRQLPPDYTEDDFKNKASEWRVYHEKYYIDKT